MLYSKCWLTLRLEQCLHYGAFRFIAGPAARPIWDMCSHQISNTTYSLTTTSSSISALSFLPLSTTPFYTSLADFPLAFTSCGERVTSPFIYQKQTGKILNSLRMRLSRKNYPSMNYREQTKIPVPINIQTS